MQSKIDLLSQEIYTVPYLRGRKANFVVYDGNNELTTLGISFGEEVKNYEGFKDASIICEVQFDEVANLKNLNELVELAENKCRGADIFTDVVLNIEKIVKVFMR